MHILSFPCNQFDLQEPAKNHEILNGLKHVRPGNGWTPTSKLKIFGKLEVNGKDEHPIYTLMKSVCPQTTELLGERQYMFWDPVKTTDITWNFEKFLIDRKGRPRYRFHPANWNGSEALTPYIEQLLAEDE